MITKKEIAELISKLVGYDSIYPKELDLGTFLFRLLKAEDIKVKKQYVSKSRFNIFAEKGRGEKSICFYGHLDTVPATPGWKTNPFILTVKGDRAYGLGAYDMKGAMAVSILTFLKSSLKNYKLKILLCCDEENISEGGYKAIKSKFLNDVECLISPEPSFAYGLNGITTGRVGRAIYQISVSAPSLHFFHYSQEKDISRMISQLILNLQKLNKKIGQANQFLYLKDARISNSTGISLANQALLEMDAALPPGKSPESLLQEIEKITKNSTRNFDKTIKITTGLKPRKTPFLSGYKINKNNDYLRNLKKLVRIVTGRKAIPYFRSSVADDNIFGSNGYTVLGIGPVGENAHGPNEWVSLKSLKQLSEIFEKFLTSYD